MACRVIESTEEFVASNSPWAPTRELVDQSAHRVLVRNRECMRVASHGNLRTTQHDSSAEGQPFASGEKFRRTHFRHAADSIAMRKLADDVFHDVDDDVGVFVENDDVGADDAALVGGRERREFANDFDGAGLKLFLQAGGQGAVAFELFFEAGRKIAVALGKTGRKA